MAYNKTTWETGDTITAQKLNNAENGIEANDTAISGIVKTFTAGNTVDTSGLEPCVWFTAQDSAEIDEALDNGNIVYLAFQHIEGPGGGSDAAAFKALVTAVGINANSKKTLNLSIIPNSVGVTSGAYMAEYGVLFDDEKDAYYMRLGS